LDGVEFADSTVVANAAFSVVFAAGVVAVVVAEIVDVPKRDGLGARAKDSKNPKDITGSEGAAVVPNRDGLGAVDCEDVAAAPAPKIDATGAAA
jgi:hypothetical protein